MMQAADIEQSEGREEAGRCMALWSAVLREAVVTRGDLAYLESADFRFITGMMGLDQTWTARKLREAVADGAPKRHAQHRPRAYRKHNESTRAKIRAAAARRRDTGEHTEWCAAISAAQAKRWARQLKASAC